MARDAHGTGGLAPVALFALAAILRLHNAWVAAPLSGFDGPYHASYVGILVHEGRLPLAHEGWSTFHPPLYYSICAAVWSLLPPQLDAHATLFAMRLVSVAAGLGLGLAVYRSAGLAFPERPFAALFAAAVALFLPMHVGPSSVLGNEVFAAALCGAGLWLLLRCLARGATPRGAAGVGAVLGLALLSKFSALVVLVTAGWALLVRGWQLRPGRAAALAPLAALALAATLASGWYFARNIQHYGRPTLMQNEIVAAEMAKQGYGPLRPAAHYASLHPAILADPYDRSAKTRSAVWPVTFASIWYDVRASTIDASSAWGRRLAWVLFGCGAIVTALAAGGAFLAARGTAPVAVPLGTPTLLLLGALTLASYAAFTATVATFSALKGSYLSPALTAFALFAGLGADALARTGRHARRAVRAFAFLLPAAVITAFWLGGLSPLRLNPAVAYVATYVDEPTRRVFDFFVGSAETPAP